MGTLTLSASQKATLREPQHWILSPKDAVQHSVFSCLVEGGKWQGRKRRKDFAAHLLAFALTHCT